MPSHPLLDWHSQLSLSAGQLAVPCTASWTQCLWATAEASWHTYISVCQRNRCKLTDITVTAAGLLTANDLGGDECATVLHQQRSLGEGCFGALLHPGTWVLREACDADEGVLAWVERQFLKYTVRSEQLLQLLSTPLGRNSYYSFYSYVAHR